MAEPSLQGRIYSVFWESRPLSVCSGVKKLRADRVRPEQRCLRELQALWWRAVLRLSELTAFIRKRSRASTSESLA